MKKLFTLLFTIIILLSCMTFLSSCTDYLDLVDSTHSNADDDISSSSKNDELWKIWFYVDEFNNPTDEAFVMNSVSFTGTFSDSAAQDAQLEAFILIDDYDISIELWEYGNYIVRAFSTVDYEIIFLDESGTKHYTYGYMDNDIDRIYLDDWTLVKLLQKNQKIQVYIKEDSSYGVNSTYLFTIENGNFNTVYNEFRNK